MVINGDIHSDMLPMLCLVCGRGLGYSCFIVTVHHCCYALKKSGQQMSHYSVAVHSGFYQCKILFNKHGVGKI